MAIPIDIVPMTREDLPQVLEIERASFPLPYSENLFHMELNLNIAHMVVAKAAGEVKGYLDFWTVEDQMYVINIAVSPKARHQGIATQLMEYLMRCANEKGAAMIFLDVRESNIAAITLYKKFGFEQIDVRKKYYQDNEENALVMRRTL